MKKVLKDIISTLLYLLCVLCLTWLVITYVGQRTVVEGSSMESTLSDGDNLIVDKISYRFEAPNRFDIIVFPFRYGEKVFYIKRIIGLPGEHVRIDETGTIFIDGELLEESYGKEVIDADTIGRGAEGVTLGKDEYFVLGDNRNDSTDSRMEIVGNVKRSQIIGKAWLRIWPLSEFGFIEH